MAFVARRRRRASSPRVLLNLRGLTQYPPHEIEEIKKSFDEILQTNPDMPPPLRSLFLSILAKIPHVLGPDITQRLEASQVNLADTRTLLSIDYGPWQDYRWYINNGEQQPEKPLSRWAGKFFVVSGNQNDKHALTVN